jgi:hypothetical protein
MAIGDQKAGLIFKITADTKEAVRDLNVLDTQIDKIAGFVTSNASTFAAVGAGVAAGIGTIVAASVAAGRALFDMSKTAADFGSAIFDASEKTGLGAETLSAMKFAADQSGSSLEQVTGTIAKFAKTVGAAAEDTKKAEAFLNDFGITPQDALRDLDSALAKVFARIVAAPKGIEQMTLAQKAFGRSGADLLPFIKSFDGDLAKLIKRAKELGVTIDDEAAREADEFGDSMDEATAAVEGLARKIVTPLIPQITNLAKAFTDLISENQAGLQRWSKETGTVIQGVIGYWEDLRRKVQEYNDQLIAAGGGPGLSGRQFGGPLGLSPQQYGPIAGGIRDSLLNRGQQRQQQTSNLVTDQASIFKFPTAEEQAAAEEARKEAEKRARELQDIARRDAAAQVAILKNKLDQIQDEEKKAFDSLKARFEESGDQKAFLGAYENLRMITNFAINDFLPALEEAEKKAAETTKKTALETQLMLQEQAQRVSDIRDRRTSIMLEKEKAIAEQAKKLTEDQRKARQEELKAFEEAMEAQSRRMVALNEEESERLKILREQTEEIEKQRSQERERFQLDPGKAPESGGFWGDLDEMTGQITGLGDVMKQLGAVAGQVFMQFGEGLGMMVENWVLMGDAADVSMKKMLATILAGVAKQAATLAIFHTAMGIAALTPWGAAIYGSAANHFAAAAIWAGVAAAAGGVGRAVAGDSFKSGTGSARGGTRSPSDLDRDQDNDLSGFGGFGNPRGRQGQEIRNPMAQQVAEWLGPHLDRQNQINGAVVEAVNTFTGKFGTAPPDHVVVAGSQTARGSQAVAVANQKAHSQGGRTSEKFYRNSGQVR